MRLAGGLPYCGRAQALCAVVKIEDIPPEWNQPVSEEGLQAASSGMNIPLEQLTSTVALELPDTRPCWAYRSVAATVADAAPVCITSEEQWADRPGEVNLIHSNFSGMKNLLSASFAASTGRVMERTIRATSALH